MNKFYRFFSSIVNNPSQVFNSALYVSPMMSISNPQFVHPRLDFFEIFKNKKKYIESLNKRNIEMDFSNFDKTFILYFELLKKYKELVKLKNDTQDGTELYSIQREIKIVQNDSNLHKAYELVLSLPNLLENCSYEKHSDFKETYNLSQNIPVFRKMNLDLANFLRVNPMNSSFNLVGTDAEVFLLIEEIIFKYLLKCGFTPFNCPDFIKPIILEACNINWNKEDPWEILRLHSSQNISNPISMNNLVSNGVQPYLAYFTRTRTEIPDSDHLIIYNISNLYKVLAQETTNSDRKYEQTPLEERCASFFILAKSKDSLLRAANEVNEKISHFYHNLLRLPHTTQAIDPPLLAPIDAHCQAYNLLVPSKACLLESANLSYHFDFVSQRLAILATDEGDSSNHFLAHTGNGLFASIPVVVACLLERFDGDFLKVHDFLSSLSL